MSVRTWLFGYWPEWSVALLALPILIAVCRNDGHVDAQASALIADYQSAKLAAPQLAEHPQSSRKRNAPDRKLAVAVSEVMLTGR